MAKATSLILCQEMQSVIWMLLMLQSQITEKCMFDPLPKFYLYTLAVSPSLGDSRQHKRTTKQWGFHFVLLAMTRDPVEFGWHCWSNTAHPPLSSTTWVPCGVGHITKNSANVFSACHKSRLKETGRGDWESPPLYEIPQRQLCQNNGWYLWWRAWEFYLRFL